MKYLFIFFVFLSFFSFGQENIIGLKYSLYDNGYSSFKPVFDDSEHHGKGSYSIGIAYQKKMHKKISFITGIEYSKNKIDVTNFSSGYNEGPFRYEIKLLTLPLLLKYDFNRYFFVNTGILFDWEIDRDRSFTDPESGLGAMLGLGVQYSFSDFYIALNPHFRIHSLIPFGDDHHYYHVVESGAALMAGYRF